MAEAAIQAQLQERLNVCFKILNEYSWLLDSYILDYFIENLAEKLPRSWRRHFEDTSIGELGSLLDLQNKSPKGVWPLSLLVLRYLVKQLSLPRQPNASIISSTNSKNNDIYMDVQISQTLPKMQKCSSSKNGLLLNPKFKHLFFKHVKPKKQCEIYKMAEITSEVADSVKTKHLVDIGSGLGHLSRITGYGFGMRVLSVESQKAFTADAQKLDNEIEMNVKKLVPDIDLNVIRARKPIHMQKTITCDMSPIEFSQFIKESFNETGENFRFGIVGLHPCGDLALKLLQLFIQCDEVKFINLVGCCYHKVTVSSYSENAGGFPVSKFCERKFSVISYEARALACHALEVYCKRLQMNDYDHLKIHCFRATLEYIINKKWPNLRKTALNNVKHGPDLTFQMYCDKALKKLDLIVPEEDANSKNTIQCLSQWKSVVLYYSLRLLLAPLVETVILIDRMLFVLENGYECRLEAVFDPEISPRNFVLVGKKS